MLQAKSVVRKEINNHPYLFVNLVFAFFPFSFIFGTFIVNLIDDINIYFTDFIKTNDYFDFIIIDECHRGGADNESNWRKILEYFVPVHVQCHVEVSFQTFSRSFIDLRADVFA